MNKVTSGVILIIVGLVLYLLGRMSAVFVLMFASVVIVIFGLVRHLTGLFSKQ